MDTNLTLIIGNYAWSFLSLEENPLFLSDNWLEAVGYPVTMLIPGSLGQILFLVLPGSKILLNSRYFWPLILSVGPDLRSR
jgi:hypothetical protein